MRQRRGRYLWLVGPDGCGKSTLAASLADDPTVQVVYWRVSVLPMARQLAGKGVETGVNSDPHARQPDSALRALARLLYYALDNVLGYLIRVRPAVRRGQTIVVDRGWADMLVDPRRYGLASSRLPGLLLHVLPKPDALLVVRVPPAVAHARKPELPASEIERQYDLWARPRFERLHRVWVDNSGTAEQGVQSFKLAVRGEA